MNVSGETPANDGDQGRSRHRVVLDYLQTLPGVLTGVAALIGATTGLVVALLR